MPRVQMEQMVQTPLVQQVQKVQQRLLTRLLWLVPRRAW